MQLKMNSNPSIVHVVAGLLLDDKGRVLIAKRSSLMSSPGLWELPGGKIEKEESHQGALARELNEELSVTVSVGDLFTRTEALIAHRQFVMFVYFCDLIRGTYRPLEHEALKWIGVNEVHHLPWAPLDIPLLEQLSDFLGQSL